MPMMGMGFICYAFNLLTNTHVTITTAVKVKKVRRDERLLTKYASNKCVQYPHFTRSCFHALHISYVYLYIEQINNEMTLHIFVVVVLFRVMLNPCSVRRASLEK